jgi:hypothetical protein
MWAALIPIIAQYGLPVAEALWQKWSSGTPPAQADWDQLKAMTKVTALDVVKARLAAAGIPLDDPKAQALIALVS